MLVPLSKVPIYRKPDDDLDAVCTTLENADYIIPAGTYPLEITWSPRFKKDLPLIEDVPDRDGIRIHKGSIPEHSRGCVLTDLLGMAVITTLFNRITNIYDNEKVSICITDDFGADSNSRL